MSETNRWVCITSTENIPLREGRSVQVAEHEIAIFNLGDRFLAVANRCPHLGGPLAEGIVSGVAVVCPLHARKVSLETGTVVSATDAPECVQTFHTRVKDGLVFLQLPGKFESKEQRHGDCVEQASPVSWLESSAMVLDDPGAKNIGA